ncbi:MAG TPA: RcnB family protein [Sphingomonas sp.]|nr:RcnB family protein [Sphingomonas sp.]
MRKLWLAAPLGAGLIFAATPAAAQQVWQNGRWVVLPPPSQPVVMPVKPHNWGPMVNGRWEAGYRAPGGWAAYRRLDRGAELPEFWRGYRVPNYLALGLAAPPQGYSWVRYYDDAVLVDTRGRVWNSVGGVAWTGVAPALIQTVTLPVDSAVLTTQAGASYPRPGTANLNQSRPPAAQPLPQTAAPAVVQAAPAVQAAAVAVAPVTVQTAPVASAPAAVVQTAPVAAAPAAPAAQTMVAMQPVPMVVQTLPVAMQVAPGAVQAMPQGNVQAYSSGGVTVIVINPAPVVTTRVVRETR